MTRLTRSRTSGQGQGQVQELDNICDMTKFLDMYLNVLFGVCFQILLTHNIPLHCTCMTLYFTRYIATPPNLIKLFCIPRFFFHKFNC